MFVKNVIFGKKWKFWLRIEIFVKDRNLSLKLEMFGKKCKFWLKMESFIKNRNFR